MDEGREEWGKGLAVGANPAFREIRESPAGRDVSSPLFAEGGQFLPPVNETGDGRVVVPSPLAAASSFNPFVRVLHSAMGMR
jgi:hypothetical protein